MNRKPLRASRRSHAERAEISAQLASTSSTSFPRPGRRAPEHRLPDRPCDLRAKTGARISLAPRRSADAASGRSGAPSRPLRLPRRAGDRLEPPWRPPSEATAPAIQIVRPGVGRRARTQGCFSAGAPNGWIADAQAFSRPASGLRRDRLSRRIAGEGIRPARCPGPRLSRLHRRRALRRQPRSRARRVPGDRACSATRIPPIRPRRRRRTRSRAPARRCSSGSTAPATTPRPSPRTPRAR